MLSSAFFPKVAINYLLPKRAYIVHRKCCSLPSLERKFIDAITMKQKDWIFFSVIWVNQINNIAPWVTMLVCKTSRQTLFIAQIYKITSVTLTKIAWTSKLAIICFSQTYLVRLSKFTNWIAASKNLIISRQLVPCFTKTRKHSKKDKEVIGVFWSGI